MTQPADVALAVWPLNDIYEPIRQDEPSKKSAEWNIKEHNYVQLLQNIHVEFYNSD